MDPDTVMVDSDAGDARRDTRRDTRRLCHFVVAVDFGTTFSSVAYVAYRYESTRPHLLPEHVELVERYPNNPYPGVTCGVVPTELWYAQKSAARIPDGVGVSGGQPLVDDIGSGDHDHDGSQTDASSEGSPGPYQLSFAPAPGSGTKKSPFWGYEVHDQLAEAENDTELARHLSRFKLILDRSPHTEKQRNRLSESCKTLKKMSLIHEDTDIIAGYLEQLFRHTKERLTDSEGYTDASTVEFVLCVPAIWNAEAARHMQVAMRKAVAQTGLGKLQHQSIDNLFIVSEPEAAAAWIIAHETKTRLTIGETFVLLDAGGGTVDAITYTVDRHEPLRLKREEVEPGGAMCGSSFINERFEDLLLKRLEPGRYLDLSNTTLSQVINGAVVEFERRDKKTMDAQFPDRVSDCTIKIPGLKAKPKKGFSNGRMCITREEVRALFNPSLEGVARVMREQFRMARAKGCNVQKVILMGGFGQSKSLSSYLRAVLETDCGVQGQNVVLDSSKFLTSSVAQGAILRALRKEDGPARILQSSYGFLRQERYGTKEAHAGQTPERDKVDGFDYIYNTIDWVVNKGDTLISEHTIERRVEYTFHAGTELVGTEYLYVSDQRHEPHYQLGHPKNAGAVEAGRVVVDMNRLKDTGRIHLKSERGRRPYWHICGTLFIYVNGRNLRYEVKVDNDDGATPSVGQTCIAAAFQPGTE